VCDVVGTLLFTGFGSGKLVRDRDNMIRFGGAPLGAGVESSKLGMCGFGINVGLLDCSSPRGESGGGEELPLALDVAANSFGYYFQIWKF